MSGKFLFILWKKEIFIVQSFDGNQSIIKLKVLLSFNEREQKILLAKQYIVLQE